MKQLLTAWIDAFLLLGVWASANILVYHLLLDKGIDPIQVGVWVTTANWLAMSLVMAVHRLARGEE